MILKILQSVSFRKSADDIEVLDCLTGGSFAEVVLSTEEEYPAGTLIVVPSDVDEVGASDILGIRAATFS